MSKLIKISIFIICSLLLTAAMKKIRKIPSPIITQNSIATAADAYVTLKGSGFIRNYNKAHKIFLKKSKQKFKIKTIASDKDAIAIKIPGKLAFGDYDLVLQLKTRFFKSKKKILRNFIQIRPKAPAKPKLGYTVIKNSSELLDLINQNQEHELILEINNELNIGLNQVKSFYYQDGFKSLLSEAVDFYYLPEEKFSKALIINSQNPISSLAQDHEDNNLDVSAITHKTIQDQALIYHLKTPSENFYLAKEILLPAIYFSEIHAAKPEHIIINNRSNKSFALSNCEIHDAIKKRFQFSDAQILYPKTQIKIAEELGLNDSGDTVSLICADSVVEEVKYTNLDNNGFAEI
jgi:hypothetical protein